MGWLNRIDSAVLICELVIDAEGEVRMIEVAPIIVDYNVDHLRVWHLAGAVTCSIPPPDINSVIILGFLIRFSCGKGLGGLGLCKVTSVS